MPAGQCTPHFLFGLAEKKTGRARSKRKERFWSRSGTFVPPRYTGVGVRWCLRVCEDLPTGAAWCRRDLAVDSRGAGAEVNGVQERILPASLSARSASLRAPLAGVEAYAFGPMWASAPTNVLFSRADTQVDPYGWAGPPLLRRGGCPHPPAAPAPVNCQASGSENRSRGNATTTPTPSAPSTTGR